MKVIEFILEYIGFVPIFGSILVMAGCFTYALFLYLGWKTKQRTELNKKYHGFK